MKKPISSEIEYLRYFFDQVCISSEERAFLEEGFELCFNKAVPDHLKMKTLEPVIKVPTLPESELNKDTEPSLPLPGIVEEVDIPKAPRIPSLKKLLLDNTQKGDYVLMHRGSGEHVSLSLLITQLKEMTRTENK
jgi:hypothetical protein